MLEIENQSTSAPRTRTAQCRGWIAVALAVTLILVGTAPLRAAPELVVGIVRWEPGLSPNATDYDRTDYWCCIAVSPSTGRYAASCEWGSRDNAVRQAREKCNAPDARAAVLCCNGWAALALGPSRPGHELVYGVGWGADRATAEKWALSGARDEGLADARVVYAINAREIRTGGAIAYSVSTAKWGYATGGRSGIVNALNNCDAPDAKIVIQHSDCWLALALGDDKSAYGVGWAGNRADAMKTALAECARRTRHARIEVVFPTNGVAH